MGAYASRAGFCRRRSILLGLLFIYVLTVLEIYKHQANAWQLSERVR